MTPAVIETSTSGFSYSSFHGMGAPPVAPLSEVEEAVKDIKALDLRLILLDEVEPQTLFTGEEIMQAKMTAPEDNEHVLTLRSMVVSCWAATGVIKMQPVPCPQLTAAKALSRAGVMEILLQHAGTDTLSQPASVLKKLKVTATSIAQRFTEVQAAFLDDGAAPFPLYLVDLVVAVWARIGYEVEAQAAEEDRVEVADEVEVQQQVAMEVGA
jgi:hypothetical protein